MKIYCVSLSHNLFLILSNMAKLLTCLILSCIFLLPLHSQVEVSAHFIHIGLNQGLSQATVFDITQDKRGNMWFATQNGLNKYDGYGFTVYQHDEQNRHSIANDVVRTCITDKSGQIWIGTEEGLSLYNADKNWFENFTYPNNSKKQFINGIVELDEKQLLLYINRQKLLIFNIETRSFSDIMPIGDLQEIVPTAISRQGDHIYIGSFEGVYDFSVSQKTVKRVMADKLNGKNILAILQQSSTALWIATEGYGLYRYNPKTGEAVNYTHSPNKKGCLNSNYVRSLAFDTQNRLWVGTINSLNIYNEKEDRFETYNNDSQGGGNSTQFSVRDIFKDSQGGMWLGTYYGGLSYYHPLKNRFQNLQSTIKPHSLSSNIINSIRESSDNLLWIGTNGGGMNCYNPNDQTMICYTRNNGLASNDVKSIYVDETNNLIYIGTHTGGLSILHRNTGKIETIKSDNLKNIYAIEPTNDGEFWMNGLSNLIRFNPQNNTFSLVKKQADGRAFLHDRILNLFRDKKHRLWIISEQGLFSYKENKGELQSCQILPEESSVNQKAINCLYETADGIFWIGTRSGIFRFDEAKNEIKQYTTAHGLPNNAVHGILEDAYGKLWISTDKGLACFYPQTEKFRNFTDDDGLQNNQFTTGAFCSTANGKMYFGGINGITSFDPKLLTDNPYIPSVVITQLRLFNKTVSPDDESGILKKSISETNSITLSAQQSMFSLEFVVSNYIAGQHNTFTYKLDGYDKEWYYSNTQRIASYSNLPHGTYRFLVKAANNDGKWNETPTELEINILPVWYKTWWAILLFIIAAIVAIAFVLRYFWIRKSMKAQIAMERIDKERQKEVNEMKLRFFINISHELRTPLTLILAPLQDMLDKVNDRWMYKQLEYMQRNTNRLLHLVNQLMDYRKAELGVFSLQVRYCNIHQVIEKNFLSYERLAQHKKLSYNFYSEIENQEILCDPNYLELIVNNLLSNAFKYTDENQSITVTLKAPHHTLLLQVKDTGSGIPTDKQGKIFERFYQVDNKHIGTGIGLSLVQRLVELYHGRIELDSSEGVGSTFSIYLPTDESAFAPEELQKANPDRQQEDVLSTNTGDMYAIDTEKEIIAEEKEPDADNTTIQPKEKILIVEDNADILQYLSRELSNSFLIFEAGNGEEALEILKKEEEISLILTDVMMPVMDGLQLCKLIKQNLRTCHIPIIILSAKADLKEQLDGLQMGADDYIPKPFSLTLVKTKIKNILRTRYRTIQHYSNSLEIEPEKIALNPLDEELLKKAIAAVEKHLDNVNFSTEEFASEMCMSRANLHLKLKALTGETTNDFIRKIRFNHACKLLKEGRYTISEISTKVGFNTASYFATSFKKYFGCLPSEYTKPRVHKQID